MKFLIPGWVWNFVWASRFWWFLTLNMLSFPQRILKVCLTHNFQRVEWPPRESMEREAPSPSPTCERVIKLATVPPMHMGMVAISKARRKRIDEDFLNFQGAAPVFSSGPFSNGNLCQKYYCYLIQLCPAAFEPKKLSSEKRWKPSTFESAPSKQMLHERPQKVLRSSSSVLTQGKSDKQAKYKMPPGTAKVHKHSKQGNWSRIKGGSSFSYFF